MKEFSEILRALEKRTLAVKAGAAPVLATLVSVEGSSYRRAGARLLWSEGGRVGGISGGCLEEDLGVHCCAVAASGVSRTVLYDTTSENDLIWGVGLGCNGIVRVLLEPVTTHVRSMLEVVRSAWARRVPVVVASVYALQKEKAARTSVTLGMALAMTAERSEGSDTGEPGEYADDEIAFSVTARECLREGRSLTRVFPDLPGVPVVFFEFLPPPFSLVVCGAGDDAKPLVRMAVELGWRVHVVDSRAAYATRERFPEAAGVGAELPTLDARTLVAVMTHHYVFDVPLMRALLPQPVAYLGLLGPKKRAEKILADLERDELVITPEMRARLHAPVGLDLGGSSPEAVALSILAEMQSVVARRDGRPLRERVGSIHGENQHA